MLISVEFIGGSIKSYFNYSLEFKDCEHSFICSSSMIETNYCTLQYGLHGQEYQIRDLPQEIQLNSPISLHLESSTDYYFRIIFTLDSLPILVSFNHTSENSKKELSPLLN